MTANTHSDPNRMLRLPDVLTLTGVSRPTLYRWAANGLFPKPVRLGPRASGWRAGDVYSWLESRA